ncbi:helix-turn-helix domain-containing protein [Asaia sp. VD9]|uniref:helix-turn-helix domain-containing protein n=1 Tax=Asaia sp. VD9 TaxID=3081235 RepID=UPI0030182204
MMEGPDVTSLVGRSSVPPSLPTPLHESWRRCGGRAALAARHIAPHDRLCAAELRQRRACLGSALHEGCVELDRLARLVAPLGYIALLSDRSGVVMAHRCESRDARRAGRWNLFSGAIWAEDAAGTNGLGTCLVEDRAMTVCGSEHWRFALHHLTCTAVPFYGTEGEILGALNVSTGRHDAPMAGIMEALLADASRAIERRLFEHRFRSARIVLLGEGTALSQEMIALDESGGLIGASRAARSRLAVIEQVPDRGSHFDACRSVPMLKERSGFREAEIRAILEALSFSQGKIAPAARLLGVSRATLHRKIKNLGIRRGALDALSR